MKTIRNGKRFCFAVISTLLLCCNLTRAAALFDPLKDYTPPKSIRPLGSVPCQWPDPTPPIPDDPNPGAPDCIAPVNCVA